MAGTQIDRRLEAAARQIVHATATNKPIVPLLRAVCPGIYRQIEQDQAQPALFSLWGKCTNIDENTGERIVAPAILKAIGQVAGVPLRGRFIHAGLQHTYGYLFSLIDTPYGKKRDRWTSPAIAQGLGLPEKTLSCTPPQGTLLANVSWVMGQIAFRDQPTERARLENMPLKIPTALVQYRFERLQVQRIVEVIKYGPKKERLATLHTDLVRYPVRVKTGDNMSHLLVYTLRTGQGPLKLITVFPVSNTVVQTLKAAVTPEATAIRLRYNAYIPGLFGKIVEGKRVLQAH